MTTTANLSVGIDTSQAFESLKRLRAEMQNQPHQLLISVDPSSVDKDIQRYLKQRTFKVSVNTKAMGDEISNDVDRALQRVFDKSDRKLGWNVAALRGGLNSAVDAAFNDSGRRLRFDRNRLVDELEASVGSTFSVEHTVRINREALTESVRAAVAAGMVGNVHVGAAGAHAGAGATLGPDLTTTLQRTLLPAVDAMERAANAIASAARKAEIAPPNGKLTAKESISQKDPVTGFTKSVSRRLDNPEAQLADVQELARLKEFGQQEVTQDRLDMLNLTGQRAIQFKARRDAAKAARDAELADAKQAAVAEAAQARLDMLNVTGERQLQFKARNESAKASARQAVADAKDASELEKAQARLDMLNVTGERQLQFKARRDAATAARAQERSDAREAAQAEAAQDKGDMLNLTGERQLQYKARQEAARAARQVEAAEAAEAQKAEQLRLTTLNNQAKFNAAGAYNGTGQRIAGAQALVQDVGAEGARAHLGSSSFLVDEIRNLEDYRTKTKAVGDEVARAREAHKALNSVLTESHAAVRGLAGALGEMWVTWGSLVPLIIGAGIGKALKDTLTIGADVEGNLARVGAMSGTAAVGLGQFNSAIVGSMQPSTEAAVGLKDLAQSGLSTSDALRALPPVLALATAGQLDLKDTTHDLVGVMNAFGLGVGDLTHIGDVIGKTAATSNISTREMLESMRAAGEVASEFKLTLGSTAAVLGVLAEKGITGAGAANQLQRVMSTLAAPTGKSGAAMKELGINAIDANKQVLPLIDALQVVKNKTDGLSEASRDLALKDMFSVRNTKALVAVIDSLDTIKEKIKSAESAADGFNRSINEAVGETVQGKFKKLITSFEIDATEAFDKAQGSLGGFIDQVRLAIESPEFKSSLTSLVNGVVSLTRAFTDHIGIITDVAVAYASFKVLQNVVVWFKAIPTAAALAEAAVAAFAAASATALAYATAGISVVLGLAAAYLVLGDHTSEAERAARDYHNATLLANEETDKRIGRLDAENNILKRQIELEYQGVGAIKARKQAEDEAKQGVARESGSALNAEKARYASLQDQLAALQKKNDVTPESRVQVQNIAKEMEALKPRIADDQTKFDKSQANDKLAAEVKFRDQIADVNKHVLEYNDALKAAQASKKALALQPLPNDLTRNLSPDEAEAKVAAAQAALSKAGGTYKSPGGHDPTDKDAVAALIEQLNQEATLAQLRNQLQKNLDDAKFPAGKDSQVNAYLAEQRAIQDTIADINLQKKAIDELTEAKKRSGLSQSQKDSIDRSLSNYNFKRQEDELKLANQQKVSGANSANRASFLGNSNELTNDNLARLDAKQFGDSRAAFNKKISNPGDAAADAQALQVEQRYAQDILKVTDKIRDDETAIAVEKARAAGLTGDDLVRQQGIIAALQTGLAVDQTTLAVRKAQESSAEATARALGKSQYDASQTAAYGWKAFWDAYTENASSAAKQVEDLLKKTTDSIEKAAEKLATTGKWNWRPIADSVLSSTSKSLVETGEGAVKKLFSPSDAADAASGVQKDVLNTKLTTSMVALDTSVTALTTTGITPMEIAFTSLVTAASSAATALASVAVTSGASSTSSGVGAVAEVAAAFAKGGVMTPYGPMSLRTYADGGVAHGPQVSVHGEGSLPEANVPLADGRSIPVSIKGGAGGSNTTSITFSPVIHIDSRSDQSQIAQLVGQSVKEGNKQLLQHLKDVGAIA